jgi:hypothetical protein
MTGQMALVHIEPPVEQSMCFGYQYLEVVIQRLLFAYRRREKETVSKAF